jgi:hypothetical protein
MAATAICGQGVCAANTPAPAIMTGIFTTQRLRVPTSRHGRVVGLPLTANEAGDAKIGGEREQPDQVYVPAHETILIALVAPFASSRLTGEARQTEGWDGKLSEKRCWSPARRTGSAGWSTESSGKPARASWCMAAMPREALASSPTSRPAAAPRISLQPNQGLRGIESTEAED